jgi:hypothetical protein
MTLGRPLARVWLSGSAAAGRPVPSHGPAAADPPRRRVGRTFRASRPLRSEHRGRTSNPEGGLCAKSLWTFKESSNGDGLPDLCAQCGRKKYGLKKGVTSAVQIPNLRPCADRRPTIWTFEIGRSDNETWQRPDSRLSRSKSRLGPCPEIGLPPQRPAMARQPLPAARPFHAKSSKHRLCGFARLATVVRYLFTSAVLLSLRVQKMSLHSKRLSLVDVRLKIFTEMGADLEAQFLGLLELRERVRLAEQTRARRPAPVVIAAVA